MIQFLVRGSPVSGETLGRPSSWETPKVYLRQIQFDAHELSENGLGFPFHLSTHHVKELFLHFLPRKFYLDGSAKVAIRCGPRESASDPLQSSVLGVTILVVEEFDFVSYKRATALQRQEQILDLLVESLTSLAEPQSADRAAISVAAEAVRAANFGCEIPIKVSVVSSGRRQKFEVVRAVGLDIGEAWFLRVFDRMENLEERYWITDRPEYLDRTHQFRKITVLNDFVEIRNARNERQVVVKLLEKTVERWGQPVDQFKVGPRYELVSIDIAQRTARAVSVAGHAFRAGDYTQVVRLLDPYREHLSAGQRARLAEANALIVSK